MNTENDKLCTPKQTKRLDLKRNSSRLKKKETNITGSSAKCGIFEAETPILTPKSRFVQSDIKINYKGLEQNASDKYTPDDESTPGTPTNSASSTDLQQRLAVSTNCRPYRLALSKRVREKMTKKRLEFYLANEIEKESKEKQIESEFYLANEIEKESKEKQMESEFYLANEIEKESKEKQIENEFYLANEIEKESKEKQTESEHHQNLETDKTFNSNKDLVDKIVCAKKELNARQAHLKKVEELKQAIFMWQTGFTSALQDLQQKIEPRLETKALLERLNIPQEMIKYINE